MKSIKSICKASFETEYNFTTFIQLPDGYGANPAKPWPAVLFLHGRDELGKEYDVLPDGGLRNFIAINSIPLVVIEPQCPADSEWVFQLDALAAFLGRMVKEYALDLDRIYLSGLSMGGFGAWHLGIRHPGLFAAVAPISGGTYPFLGYPEAVSALRDVPVWAFHGKDDDILPLSLTKVLVDELTKVGGKVRHTYYDNTGHNAWTQAYTDMEFYDWLLGQRRSSDQAR